MTQVAVRPRATADIAGIARHPADHAGWPVAEEYRLRSRAAFRRLAVFPDSDPPRPVLGQAVRLMAVGPYVILHRHDRDRGTVFALRVLHGRRRLTVDAT
jgi:plasmid stabilization system protein ParE